MKWIITCLAIVSCTIACKKSPLTEDQGMVAAASAKTNGLVGTWTLVQYYQDTGTGSGQWIVPDFVETISFTSEGEFSSSASFPLSGYGYTRYVAKDRLIAFYSNNGSDTYEYLPESPTRLLFFPKCRETCTRRYVLK